LVQFRTADGYGISGGMQELNFGGPGVFGQRKGLGMLKCRRTHGQYNEFAWISKTQYNCQSGWHDM